MGLIVFMLLGFILIYVFRRYVTNEDAEESIVDGLFFGVLPSIGIFFILFLVAGDKLETKETEKIQEISALNDSSTISGRHFLGSGTVEETQSYFYMVESNRGKQMKKIKVSDEVHIKEEDTETPRLVTYKKEFVGKFPIFLFGKETDKVEYVFYIPENSVTTEFNVDME